MSDNNEDLKVLSDEELRALIERLESEGDNTSDLSRSVFTLVVLSIEYNNLMVALQAYQQASYDSMHDLAGAFIKQIGIRDMKKMQKLYKLAGQYAAGITPRVSSYLEKNQSTEEPNKEVENVESNN